MAMHSYQVLHHFSAEQYVKEMHIPAGYAVGKHVHSFEHFSILVSGSVQLIVDGAPRELVAPAIVKVAAGHSHTIKAHTDSVWLCTHAIKDTDYGSDPKQVDAVLIAKGK